MPTIYHFRVNMNPVPKQYQRVTQQGGHVWAFTPDNVVKAERKIHDAAEGKGAWYAEHVGVRVNAIFWRAIPDSPTVNRIKQLCARLFKPFLPTITPDIDNYEKTLQDALSGLTYVDDSQITDIHIKKRWVLKGEVPHIEFTLTEDDGDCLLE